MQIDLELSSDVSDAFPGHGVGAVFLQGPQVSSIAEGLGQRVPAQPESRGSVTDITAIWRDVFAKMGAKPKYQCSLATLATRAEEPARQSHPLPMVSFYNWYSLARAIPMAGYDARYIDGRLRLVRANRANRQLPFVPLGEPRVTQHLRSGEIAYVDDSKVVCRYWNWHDCHETRLRADTEETLLVFDLVEREWGSVGEQFEQVRSDMSEAFGALMTGGVLLEAGTPAASVGVP